MYPKVAKFAVWSTVLVFAASLFLLLISMILGNHRYIQMSAMILFLLLPFWRAYKEYVIDPVGNAIKELKFVETPELLCSIQHLLKDIDQNICVGVYESQELNAFAISSVFGNRSLIAFSSALIDTMPEKQFLAIAAHEIAHIKNSDSMNKSYVLAFHQMVNFYPGLISQLSKEFLKAVIGIFLFLALAMFLLIVKAYDAAGITAAIKPILSLFQPLLLMITPVVVAFVLKRLTDIYFFHYSRQREFAADAAGAEMTSKSDLKQALQLLSDGKTYKRSFFDTHPPIADRLKQLTPD